MYLSRFAPTPSGPLHFGSLVCALAGYLDAKHQNGQWHLRIEDLDPPRVVAGSDIKIIRQLEQHHLFWDGPITYQSHRSDFYHAALEFISHQSNVYRCDCTRRLLNQQNGFELGHCQENVPPKESITSVRMKMTGFVDWKDPIQGEYHVDLDGEKELILKRRDGLIAYPLAVVVDDIALGVTHLIRGSDLIDVAASQQYLYQTFNQSPPNYAHIPVASNKFGQKLSKQNHAPELNDEKIEYNLREALSHLGQTSEEATGTAEDIIRQAIIAWDINRVPKKLQIEAPSELALDY